MRTLIVLFSVAFTLSSVSAQMNYTRSTFKSTYVPLGPAAIKINSGGNPDQFSNASGQTSPDDGTAYISLPFNFTFAGATYTTANYLGICTNGYVFPSIDNDITKKVITAGNDLNSSNNVIAHTPIIAPYWDDLFANTNVDGITGSVKYEVTGNPGSKVLTIEWSNYPSYNNVPARALNFQVKLYEGSNIIEFLYGAVTNGTKNSFHPSESATIGIKNAIGGITNFIDAITGSSYVSSASMNSLQFPRYNFRFSPSVPAPIATGIYTVGSGQSYFNLSEAVADLNHRGVSGQVTLRLTDALYDTSIANGSNIFPLLLGPIQGSSASNQIIIESSSGNSTIQYRGNPAGGVIYNAADQPVITSANEPIIGLLGADWVSLRNVSLSQLKGGTGYSSAVKRGILLMNFSTSDGAQNNTIQDLTVSLDRTYLTTIGIQQISVSAPSQNNGTNSANKFYNVQVNDAYSGIYLLGDAAVPDLNCEIGSINGGKTIIGGSALNDIGNGNQPTWGIRASYQSGCKIFKTEIRNISASSNVEGIHLENFSGTNDIFGNIVHHIKNTGSTSLAPAVGIKATPVSGIISATVHIYNNFVSQIVSSYSGSPISSRLVKGIFAAGTNNSSVQEYDIDYNSVNIDGSSSPNCSSTCFESVEGNAPLINIRNNAFANSTGAQSSANHYSIVVSSNTLGNAGSVMDHNDYYLANTTNGFIGSGGGTNRKLLSDWQGAFQQDTHSISADPLFYGTTDLHSSSSALNNAANASGISWVTNDIDGDTRCAASGCPGNETRPDIGADEFSVGVALSVPFISFTGKREGSSNVLRWAVDSERDVLGFFIERSLDGIEFTSIGFVRVEDRSVIDNHFTYYFRDNQLAVSKQYYRIREVDVHGKALTSSILTIYEAGNLSWKIQSLFPNPVFSVLTVSLDCPELSQLRITVSDVNGKIVKEWIRIADKGASLIDLNVKDLQPGLYFFSIQNPAIYPVLTAKFYKR